MEVGKVQAMCDCHLGLHNYQDLLSSILDTFLQAREEPNKSRMKTKNIDKNSQRMTKFLDVAYWDLED